MFDTMFDKWDLGGAHAVLCLIGIVMSVWCHQLWGRGALAHEVAASVRGMQRASFILYALSLCWSLSFAHVRHWQPWPSYLVTLFAVDLYLFAILMAANYRHRVFN